MIIFQACKELSIGLINFFEPIGSPSIHKVMIFIIIIHIYTSWVFVVSLLKSKSQDFHLYSKTRSSPKQLWNSCLQSETIPKRPMVDAIKQCEVSDEDCTFLKTLKEHYLQSANHTFEAYMSSKLFANSPRMVWGII